MKQNLLKNLLKAEKKDDIVADMKEISNTFIDIKHLLEFSISEENVRNYILPRLVDLEDSYYKKIGERLNQ